MTTSELKSSIVENVMQVDDEELLNDIDSVLKMKNEHPVRIILQDWQKKRIEEGIKQIENGDYKTSEDIFKEIEEWLKR